MRINLAKFFKYTGVFLIVVAAGILSYGIGALQTGRLAARPERRRRSTSVRGSTGRPGTARSFRASSTSRPRRPCCSSRRGWPTSSSCSTIFLRPTKAPAKPDPSPQPPTRTRKVDHVNTSSSIAVATAAAGGSGTDELPGQGGGETAPNRPTSAPRRSPSTASDTALRAVGHRRRQPAPSTFVITNNGTKVTEFYVYGEGERVMGEVENISPGCSAS